MNRPLCVFLAWSVAWFGSGCLLAAETDEPTMIQKPWKKKLSAKPMKAGEPAGPFAPGQWADVAKLPDPLKHARGGRWKVDAGEIRVSDAEGPARLSIPVAPRGAYGLKIEFTRQTDGMVGVVLPVGKRQCLLAINAQGAANGLDMIQGRRATDNASTFQAALVNGRKYLLEVAVRGDDREASVTVTLDDRPLVFYRGPGAALSLHRQWGLPSGGVLGLAVQCDAVFHRVALRSSSDQVTALP